MAQSAMRSNFVNEWSIPILPTLFSDRIRHFEDHRLATDPWLDAPRAINTGAVWHVSRGDDVRHL
jgi:hypothetical protein